MVMPDADQEKETRKNVQFYTQFPEEDHRTLPRAPEGKHCGQSLAERGTCGQMTSCSLHGRTGKTGQVGSGLLT